MVVGERYQNKSCFLYLVGGREITVNNHFVFRRIESSSKGQILIQKQADWFTGIRSSCNHSNLTKVLMDKALIKL